LRSAGEAVANTPNQLEVLRRAGVVDSGGEGYRVIVEAAWMWSTGRSLEGAGVERPHGRALLDELASHEGGSTYGFCTEFLLRGSDLGLDEVRSRMEALGDSVITVGDASLLRVHVHTMRPGQALEFAVDHGTLVKVKVDNMQVQHDAFAARGETPNGRQADDERTRASSIGVVAVAAGDGLARVFRSLGATVVQGGQTMNPSVQEILSAVSSAGYKELIILPNNSNIILTARHVQQLTPHRVEVVPTETAPQGIGALLAFNYQADVETNVAAMEQAAHGVHTVEITRSVRDAEVDGHVVRAGQSLGLYDGRVVASGGPPDDVLLESFGHLEVPIDSLEIVTIYYGADATEGQAQSVAARIREAHPGLAVEVVNGGQPHYPYVVSLE
jgi:DAK2 domain fusion protein YloV